MRTLGDTRQLDEVRRKVLSMARIDGMEIEMWSLISGNALSTRTACTRGEEWDIADWTRREDGEGPAQRLEVPNSATAQEHRRCGRRPPCWRVTADEFPEGVRVPPCVGVEGYLSYC